jgi:hypothetical protein
MDFGLLKLGAAIAAISFSTPALVYGWMLLVGR